MRGAGGELRDVGRVGCEALEQLELGRVERDGADPVGDDALQRAEGMPRKRRGGAERVRTCGLPSMLSAQKKLEVARFSIR